MTSDTLFRCSIIIRCYNEEEHIAKLLAGILQQTISGTEIILVDSGSTDATLSIAAQYPVKVLYISPEDFSFGRALNLGCEEATGNILIFISAHCYPVYTDWLEYLIKPFSDPDVVLSYGKQIGDATSKFSERQVFSKWFPAESNDNQETPFNNNANAAIRKSEWIQYHYNEELTGLEDLDWANRAIIRGKKIAYSSEAVIVHLHHEEFRQIRNRYRREATALKTIFPNERFSLSDFISLFIKNSISDMAVAFREKCLLKNIRGILMFRYMQFSGTYEGFSDKKTVTQQLRNTFYYPNTNKQVLTQKRSPEKRKKIQYSSFDERE
ncbi:glycosyltransferase [uncultured Methanoregula sp.]|uniref:glycosyltransferase n=1 Tax=uncultured Methanoregula sp. TaxID=1005933 RepID=UPI002AAAD6BF|nr:glycosyltransferase [uncultured Methanoregula sp.]